MRRLIWAFAVHISPKTHFDGTPSHANSRCSDQTACHSSVTEFPSAYLQKILKATKTTTNNSQRTTKPTIRLVRPAKAQISLRIRAVWSVFADRMCLLQPPGYPERDQREPLPNWVDVQAELSLCWSHRSYCSFCRALAHRLLVLVKSALARH